MVNVENNEQDTSGLPASVARVSRLLRELGNPHAPVMLADTAHTAQEAADALGVNLGQIVKSIVFRRKSDDRAVLVATSGDRRVDEAKVAAIVGPLGRADANFVKKATGFSIGGVCPIGLANPTVILIDRDLFRFDLIWTSAGHPHSMVALSPDDLVRFTGAPVEDVAETPQQ